MFANKPIIGLAGGIGSGKTFVASLFAAEGCLVLSADEAVIAAYADPRVQQTLRQWWGDTAIDANGTINRRWIADQVFSDDTQRRRLENLLHPLVEAARTEKMNQFAKDNSILAFIWDVPLLFEAGQNRQCDFVVFVDSPLPQRQIRVHAARGWTETDLIRRENVQMPLDKKREMSDYIIVNAADAAETRRQVRDVLSQILQVSKAQ